MKYIIKDKMKEQEKNKVNAVYFIFGMMLGIIIGLIM